MTAVGKPITSDPKLGSSPCLRARNLTLDVGGLRLLQDVSFDLTPGSIILLRGGNGSGKTSLLNALSGYMPVRKGTIDYVNGECIQNLNAHSPERIARLGVARLWQDVRLFPHLSVLANVLTATPQLMHGSQKILAFGVVASILGVLCAFVNSNLSRLFIGVAAAVIVASILPLLRSARIARTRALSMALDNLTKTGLEDRIHSTCNMLSVGQMKRVALARLLQMDAAIWLLDEPLAGLDIKSSVAFRDLLSEIKRQCNVSMLIVEHRGELLLDLADEIWSLADGKIQHETTNNGNGRH